MLFRCKSTGVVVLVTSVLAMIFAGAQKMEDAGGVDPDASEADKGDDSSSATGRNRFLVNSGLCLKPKLRNGRIKLRGQGRVAKFICNVNYNLVGKRYATCVRGHWTNPPPICVARGCKVLSNPNNGMKFEAYRGALITFDCNPGYVLYGSTTLFCDGFKWNATEPSCKPATREPSTFCDFESEDLCGWSHDPTHQFDWKRHKYGTPSGHVGTGPSHDHTKGEGNDGYYMYIEASSPRKENDTARLLSPVYPPDLSQNACFSFWYHMYGATIGFLRIFVKPESKPFGEVAPSFYKAGNQGNRWLMGSFGVKPINENFQIIIEGIRGVSYISDIAIDDVKLANLTDCLSNPDTEDTSPPPASIPQPMNGSCHERCGYSNPEMEECQCSKDCVDSHTCCRDYVLLCVAADEEFSSTPHSEVTSSILPSVVVVSSVNGSSTSHLTSTTVGASEDFQSSFTAREEASSKMHPSVSSPLHVTSSQTPSFSFSSTISISNAKTVLFTASSSTLMTLSPPMVASSIIETPLPSTPAFYSSTPLLSSLNLTLSNTIAPSPVMSSTLFASSSFLSVTNQPISSFSFSVMSPVTFSSKTTSVKPSPSLSVPIISSSVTEPASTAKFVVNATITPTPIFTEGKSSVSKAIITSPATESKQTLSTPVKQPQNPQNFSSTSIPSKFVRPTMSSITTTTTSSPSVTVSIQSPKSVSITAPVLAQNSTTDKPLPSNTFKTYFTWKWTTRFPKTKRPDVQSQSLKAGPSSSVTAGVVIATILMFAFVALVIYLVYKRRKTKQEMLADDSDIRYLKDGEIHMEFSDGSRIYDDDNM